MSQRRELSTIAALVAPVDTPARLLARHFPDAVRGPQVVGALRAFHRRIGRPLRIVWDQLSAHPGAYQVEWLPSYAPDLNPEELCNGAVKRDLRNALPASVADLRRQVRRSFRRLGRRADLLRSFFDHAGLDVT